MGSLILFVFGIILLVCSVLFLFFPDMLDELSNLTSQVVLNFETQVTKTRIPAGIILFVVGVWILWTALKVKT